LKSNCHAFIAGFTSPDHGIHQLITANRVLAQKVRNVFETATVVHLSNPVTDNADFGRNMNRIDSRIAPLAVDLAQPLGPPPTPGTISDIPVIVSEVQTRQDLNEFISLPWQIYKGDRNWAPPLWVEAQAFLDRRRHPFYLHGAATQFIARREQAVVGRVLVSDDPNYNKAHATNVGCFGMFESLDDETIGDALLDASAEWLARRGRTELMGPIDYSTNYPCGLLIEGFDTPQRVLMNHNPPYYAKLLESWGLTKVKDLHGWWFDCSCPKMSRWASRAARTSSRGKIEIRQLTFKDFDAEVARCMELYNQAWENNWGFVKMTEAEFRDLAKHLKQFAEPQLMLMAEVAGRPAGLAITIPDFNQATRPLNGRLTTFGLPLGLFRLWRNMRRIRAGRVLVLGVLPEFRGRGVTELLILRTREIGQRLGYVGAELGWTLEDNALINRPIQKAGAVPYKRFRIYHSAT
jgi:GNAT superfamily N-acetyltransferase